MGINFNRSLILLIAGLTVMLVMVVHGAIRQPLVEAGDEAPGFSFQSSDGRTIHSTSFGGKLLVLNFWATWCSTCMTEMPSLNQLASEMENDGVVVAAVSIDHNERAYRQFIQQERPRFLTSRDPDGELAASFGTFRVPETYVIDTTGRVRQKYVSNRNWVDPQIVTELRSFLK